VVALPWHSSGDSYISLFTFHCFFFPLTLSPFASHQYFEIAFVCDFRSQGLVAMASNQEVEISEKVPRITYADDVEDRPRTAARPSRRLSTDSMSIRSISRQRSVDPSLVLPPAFRTL
jgi:hypothetical protein